MDETSRIRKGMAVVTADGRAIGVVRSVGAGGLKISYQKDGRAFEHTIPVSWVADVERYVFLNKSSPYVAANWDGASTTGYSHLKPRAA